MGLGQRKHIHCPLAELLLARRPSLVHRNRVRYDSTDIMGSRQLTEELCASEMLEVLQIAPEASLEDHLNV